MVTPDDKRLEITWGTPEDDGGVALTQYQVNYWRNSLTRPSDADFNSYTPDKYYGRGLVSAADGTLRKLAVNLTNGVLYAISIATQNSAGLWSADS